MYSKKPHPGCIKDIPISASQPIRYEFSVRLILMDTGIISDDLSTKRQTILAKVAQRTNVSVCISAMQIGKPSGFSFRLGRRAPCRCALHRCALHTGMHSHGVGPRREDDVVFAVPPPLERFLVIRLKALEPLKRLYAVPFALARHLRVQVSPRLAR